MTKQHLFSVTKKDFKIDFFSGSGAGGQYRNKHQNCVRLQHLESGAMATGQSERSRAENIKEALQNLVKNPKFKVWYSSKILELDTGKTAEERVEEQMKPENLKIEVRGEEGWEEEK